MIEVNIVADSFCEESKCRITTFSLRYPRFILAEFNTHRVFSRNSQSSRAIPITKSINEVLNNPAMPFYFGKNKSGMQATEELSDDQINACKNSWMRARMSAASFASELNELGLHKQHVNRVIEPFSHVSTLVTSTDWTNFYRLRCDKNAQPEFRELAKLMLQCHTLSCPKLIKPGEWHLPYGDKYNDGLSTEDLVKVCTARCARVSYLTHDGKVGPEALEKDLALYANLLENKHLSPFEHCAMATWAPWRVRNFRGFIQHREFINCDVSEELPIDKLAKELL